MDRFTRIVSVAAPLPEADIDTDILFPARFLLLPDKKGLGKYLFHERRSQTGSDQATFVLNSPPFDRAEILVAGPNFGCGSSREQAVWALSGFGIRCVIAPSFGEIFYNNCFKNGVLPIRLADAQHTAVLRAAEAGAALGVDLEQQNVSLPSGDVIHFDIDPYRRRAMLLGLDEIGAILSDDIDDIVDFERRQRALSPWLHLGEAELAFFSDLGKESDVE
jgi:3-isopropylmalate/(R)-2-methylmalate dehydratase small subunit